MPSRGTRRKTADLRAHRSADSVRGVPVPVLSLVRRESLALVAAGIVLGLAAAYAASGVVTSMLFGLSPVDSVTYGAVPLILVAVALLASLVPARRATRINPVVALRAE